MEFRTFTSKGRRSCYVKKKHSVKLALLALLALSLTRCKKDDIHPLTDDAAVDSTSSTAPRAAASYNLINSLPKGYVKNGKVDYTKYVQDALKKYTNITFPNFPILVNDGGLSVRSNTTIIFPSGSKVLLKASSKGNYAIFDIDGVSNVTLTNPVIIGDKADHKGSSGEWGMGINIAGSNNVTVTGANVINCWGDGIYVGPSHGKPSTNIKITGATLNYNRRDGMSVTSTNGLVVDGSTLEYNGGTSPECGINLEPATSKDEIQNVTISNVTTGYNPGYGIQFTMKNMYGGSNKNIGVKIINHQDIKSKCGLKVSQSQQNKNGREVIKGSINVTSPNWKQNPSNPVTISIPDKNTSISIVSPKVQDAKGIVLTEKQVTALLSDKHCIDPVTSFKILYSNTPATPSTPPTTNGVYNLVNSLPNGYVKDGSVDYTSYVQSALGQHTNIIFPAFPILVNDGGLSVRSNSTLTFPTGSKIVLKSSSKSAYNIFSLQGVNNVTMTNPVIVGDKASHQGSSGESGRGISIVGSSNIAITGANVSYCYGDGIYVGGLNGTPSQNIKITDAEASYNKKDGIAVSSAISLTLEAPFAWNNAGGSTQAGIDIEPASSSDQLQDIVVNNAKTQDSGSAGIVVALANLYGGSSKQIGVTISGHMDKRSPVALRITAPQTKRNGSETISGTIAVNNPFWRQNAKNPMSVSLPDRHTHIKITNPRLQNMSERNLNDASIKTLLTSNACLDPKTFYSLTF